MVLLTLGLVFVSIVVQSSATLDSSAATSSSSSSSSSSGSTIVLSSQTNTNSEIFCSSGFVSCTSSLVPACSDPSYKPTCLPGFPNNAIDCCKNTSVSFDCKSEIPLCKVSTTTSSSSSSSGSINIGAYCQDDMVFCSEGSLAICSDQTYIPKCLPGFSSGSIECCKNNGISLNCRPELAVTCPNTNTTPTQNQFQTVTVDVVSNPKLPDVVELPLATDAFVNRSGFAYTGSNPSFEIKLPKDDPKTTIASVDLKDSSGFIYKDIPFTVTPISGQPEKYILNLSIPDSIKEGETKFALNLSDGTSLSGVIYTFSPLDISVFKGKGVKTRKVSKPIITRISISRIKNRAILNVKGDNFIGKTFLYKDNPSDNVDTLVESTKDMSNTQVTIFPSSLKAEIKKISVFNSGTEMKVTVDFPFSVVPEKTDAELIVSTPGGIASRLFTLKSDVVAPRKPVSNLQGEAFCSVSGKVLCSNGLKAYCTNSAYSTRCIAGFPQKTPDCCKKDNRSLNCRAELLRCAPE